MDGQRIFRVHYLFLEEWKKEFPNARVLGVENTKLDKSSKLKFDALWGSDPNEIVLGDLKDEFESECPLHYA
jgi:hypothetical protein